MVSSKKIQAEAAGSDTNLKVVSIPVALLKPYVKNAKLHEGQSIQVIKDSIQRFGFCDPIDVDKDGVIIAGHGRWMAVKELGYTRVPCIVHDMTAEEARAYRLIHNKSGEIEGYNFDLLDEELASLKDNFDLESFGFISDDGFGTIPSIPDGTSPGSGEDGAEAQVPVPAESHPKYTVIVHCDDADSQQALFNQLRDGGYNVMMK